MDYPTTYPIVFERNEPGTTAELRNLWFARQTPQGFENELRVRTLGVFGMGKECT
jgi:hypothetical protein